MGLVYGRMNFSESRSRGDMNNSSCSPSKSKTAPGTSIRSQSQVGGSGSGSGVDLDVNSDDSLQSPRVTKQTSRNLASHQRMEIGLRRSARLLRGSSSGGGGQMNRNLRNHSSRDNPSDVQSRLRRSVRVARLSRLKGNKQRGSSNDRYRRQAFANPSRMASSLRAISDRQVIQTRRSARLASSRSSQ